MGTAEHAYDHLYRMIDALLRVRIDHRGGQAWRKADPDKLVADLVSTLRAGLDPALGEYAVRLASSTAHELMARCSCAARPVQHEDPLVTQMRLTQHRAEVTP